MTGHHPGTTQQLIPFETVHAGGQVPVTTVGKIKISISKRG